VSEDDVAAIIRAMFAPLGACRDAESGEGITHRRAPMLERSPDTDARILAMLEAEPGRLWRLMLAPVRAWAETETSDDRRPYRGRGWLAQEALRHLSQLEEAERLGSFDAAILSAMALNSIMRDLREMQAIEALWDRGGRDREARQRGGREAAKARQAPHAERIEAVEAKMAATGLSAARAAFLLARERPDLGKADTIRKSWAARKKLGTS
jgi:hypothetical protein